MDSPAGFRGLVMKKTLLLFFFLISAAPAEAADIAVVIDIEGMTCSLCVTSVNQALRKTEGVIKAKTSLKTRQAEVVVPEDFPIDVLQDAIKQTGYTGTVSSIRKLP